MTAIAALVDRETGLTVMGGDAALVTGYEVVVNDSPKVFHNESYLMGGAGSFRANQVIEHVFRPPSFPHMSDLGSLRFMVSTFVPSLRVCLIENGVMSASDIKLENYCMLVACGSHLYMIDSDFQVAEYTGGFASIGVGREYAVGSMYSTKGQDQYERVRVALMAAAEFNGAVRAPFTILDVSH